MAKLVVETFQVCLGTDTSDPAPELFAQGLLVEDDAKALCNRLTEMALNKQLDASLIAGRVFYVRTTPGAQHMQLTAQNRPSVRTALGSGRFSVPVFVKTTDDAGGSVDYVRAGTVPSDARL